MRIIQQRETAMDAVVLPIQRLPPLPSNVVVNFLVRGSQLLL